MSRYEQPVKPVRLSWEKLVYPVNGSYDAAGNTKNYDDWTVKMTDALKRIGKNPNDLSPEELNIIINKNGIFRNEPQRFQNNPVFFEPIYKSASYTRELMKFLPPAEIAMILGERVGGTPGYKGIMANNYAWWANQYMLPFKLNDRNPLKFSTILNSNLVSVYLTYDRAKLFDPVTQRPVFRWSTSPGGAGTQLTPQSFLTDIVPLLPEDSPMLLNDTIKLKASSNPADPNEPYIDVVLDFNTSGLFGSNVLQGETANDSFDPALNQTTYDGVKNRYGQTHRSGGLMADGIFQGDLQGRINEFNMYGGLSGGWAPANNGAYYAAYMKTAIEAELTNLKSKVDPVTGAAYDPNANLARTTKTIGGKTAAWDNTWSAWEHWYNAKEANDFGVSSGFNSAYYLDGSAEWANMQNALDSISKQVIPMKDNHLGYDVAGKGFHNVDYPGGSPDDLSKYNPFAMTWRSTGPNTGLFQLTGKAVTDVDKQYNSNWSSTVSVHPYAFSRTWETDQEAVRDTSRVQLQDVSISNINLVKAGIANKLGESTLGADAYTSGNVSSAMTEKYDMAIKTTQAPNYFETIASGAWSQWLTNTPANQQKFYYLLKAMSESLRRGMEAYRAALGPARDLPFYQNPVSDSNFSEASSKPNSYLRSPSADIVQATRNQARHVWRWNTEVLQNNPLQSQKYGALLYMLDHSLLNQIQAMGFDTGTQDPLSPADTDLQSVNYRNMLPSDLNGTINPGKVKGLFSYSELPEYTSFRWAAVKMAHQFLKSNGLDSQLLSADLGLKSNFLDKEKEFETRRNSVYSTVNTVKDSGLSTWQKLKDDPTFIKILGTLSPPASLPHRSVFNLDSNFTSIKSQLLWRPQFKLDLGAVTETANAISAMSTPMTQARPAIIKEIADNQARIDQNLKQIALNNLPDNQGDIDSIDSEIALNTAKISENEAAIKELTKTIAENSATIASNTALVSTKSTLYWTKGQTLTQKTAALTEKQTELNTVNASIQKKYGQISADQIEIQLNESTIARTRAEIAALDPVADAALIAEKEAFIQPLIDYDAPYLANIAALNNEIDNTLKPRLNVLTPECNSLKAEIDALVAERKQIGDEITAMKAQSTSLTAQNTALNKSIISLKTEIAALKLKNVQLANSKPVVPVNNSNAFLIAENEKLAAEILNLQKTATFLDAETPRLQALITQINTLKTQYITLMNDVVKANKDSDFELMYLATKNVMADGTWQEIGGTPKATDIASSDYNRIKRGIEMLYIYAMREFRKSTTASAKANILKFVNQLAPVAEVFHNRELDLITAKSDLVSNTSAANRYDIDGLYSYVTGIPAANLRNYMLQDTAYTDLASLTTTSNTLNFANASNDMTATNQSRFGDAARKWGLDELGRYRFWTPAVNMTYGGFLPGNTGAATKTAAEYYSDGINVNSIDPDILSGNLWDGNERTQAYDAYMQLGATGTGSWSSAGGRRDGSVTFSLLPRTKQEAAAGRFQSTTSIFPTGHLSPADAVYNSRLWYAAVRNGELDEIGYDKDKLFKLNSSTALNQPMNDPAVAAGLLAVNSYVGDHLHAQSVNVLNISSQMDYSRQQNEFEESTGEYQEVLSEDELADARADAMAFARAREEQNRAWAEAAQRRAAELRAQRNK